MNEISAFGENDLPFRDPRPAHSISCGGHTGWFIDDFYDDIFTGYVFRLPHGRFAIGYRDSMSDGYMIDKTSVFDPDDEIGAALAADSMAEAAAREEREYQARENARMRLEEGRNELAQMLREFRALKRQCDVDKFPRLADQIATDIESRREELHQLAMEAQS